MNGIKDLLGPFLGNHRWVFACGEVTEECAVAELDVPEVKAGDECFVGSDLFRCSLVKSQLVIVNGREGDGRDVGPGECISDYIVFSTDVTHVCGKLADERQVSPLLSGERSAALVKAKVRSL